MLSKNRVLEIIKRMPNVFTIDELIERLLFIQNVEKGLEQSKKGEIISTKEGVTYTVKASDGDIQLISELLKSIRSKIVR